MVFWRCFNKRPVVINKCLTDSTNKKITLTWNPYITTIVGKEITFHVARSGSMVYFDASQVCNMFKKEIDFTTFTDKIDYQNIDSITCFTYVGILKFLFTCSSKHVIDFQKWYDSEILLNLNYMNTVISIFETFEFSCIYLLYIGTYREYKNVYKFGRTDNFQRRYKELNKTYNTTFKIVTLQYIDPDYVPKAEVEVNKFVAKDSITIDNFNELISTENINPVIALYKELGLKYSANNKPLKDKIIELEHKLELTEKDLLIAQKENKLLTLKLGN